MVADVTQLASRRVSYQQVVQRRATQRTSSLWGELASGDIERAWRAMLPRWKLALVVSQRLSAEGSAEYVTSAIGAQGATSRRLASVPARVFAGYAPDGRELDGALVQTMNGVRADLDAGLARREALDRGERRALRLVQGVLGDTARVADGVAVALEPAASGYVRRVSVPACGRCLVLAGKFFARNKGFQRHPRCDCTHVPVTRSWAAPGADELLSRMTPEQRIAALGKDNAEAVAKGADVTKVVNAQRGMSSPSDRYTTEGTSKRGAMPGGQRMTPAALLESYGDDPARFRMALRANGYLP